MASAEFRQIALMSIHTEYADAILAGNKKVEFRKRILGPSIKHVLIYATKPRSEVVGSFEVEQQEVMTPKELWKKMGEIGCITHKKFHEYFADSRNGVGIRIGSVTVAEHPVSVQALGLKRPPQSVQYLDMSILEALELLCPPEISAD